MNWTPDPGVLYAWHVMGDRLAIVDTQERDALGGYIVVKTLPLDSILAGVVQRKYPALQATKDVIACG